MDEPKKEDDEDGGSNPRCADALYCMPMPRTSSESSTKVHLQRTLRRGDRVIEVRTLTRCGTAEQSLVLLEAMKSPASDDVTTLVENRKGDVDFKLLMTEVCSVKFTSPKGYDVISTAKAILKTDPELTECNVVMKSDHEKNAVSITGSWHAISFLRSQLMAVFCSATEKQQLLEGEAVQSLVDSVLVEGNIQEGEDARNAEEFGSTANAEQSTKDVSPSQNDDNSIPENGSLAVDTFPSLNPQTVQLMRRLNLFDATYIQCSEDFTTVRVVGESEPATRAGEAFISKYQDLILGKKIITETVFTRQLPEEQYALLLSEIEDQHPEVLCQPQFAQQSMVLFALEQSKLLKAKQHIASFSPGKQLPKVPPRPSHTTPQHTSPRDTTLPLLNGGMLTVKRGDLLKEKVTAIVNAANEQLDHIGGVAFAIDRASWGNVQRESKKVIQKSGRVPTGQVAVTGAGGRLQCQCVIHAVGPDANVRPHKECEQLLKLVCENVLHTAEAQGMVSIALPAISSGIYAMKKDVVAQILISTILHYPYQHSSSVKDIRIVLFEEETLRPFLQFASEAKKGMPPGTAQRVEPDEVEIPLEKTHRKMVIKKAHFIYEDADIKVAAICSELGFQTGSNKELDGHLKGQLSEAVRGRYQYRRPGKFDVFTVHVQHATISCRYLVIVNILDRSLGTRHDGHKYLQQILQAVCQEADTLEMPSVAIAPNTFTVGGFQKGFILPEFIRVISHFRFTNDDFLTDVRFLAVNQDGFNGLVADAERTVGTISRNLAQLALVASQAPLGSSHPSSSPLPQPPIPLVDDVPDRPPGSGTDSSKVTQLPSPGPGMTKLSEHVFFALARGDLCKVQADAVVVPVAPSLDLKAGVLWAVDAASGGAISRAVKQMKQTKQKVSEGTAIPAEVTGGLPCKHIILLIRNAKGNSDALGHACREALKLAEGLGAHSVTFPPISSNKGKDRLAKCMMGTFATFLPQNSRYFVSVTVVIRENDEATLQAFRSLVGEGTTDQGKDELPQQLKSDGDTFATPPDSPSQSHLGPPCLEDDPSAKVDQGTAV